MKVEITIDPKSSEEFSYVFDETTCLPIEPIQRFLNYCRKRGLAPNTITAYAYRLTDFWRWLGYRKLDWTKIGLTELTDFANWYLLGSEEKLISTSQRSPRTVNQAITAVQGMYEFLAIDGYIEDKRFRRFSYSLNRRGGFLADITKTTPENRKRIKLKEPKKFPGCLSDKDIHRLVNACLTYRDQLIILLLRAAGIRRGELLGLYLEDVENFDINGRIKIVRRSNPNRAWAKGVEREIPILLNRKTVQQTFSLYLLNEYPIEAETKGHGMLFVNLTGKNIGSPLSAPRVNKLFEQLYTRTGIKAYPHLLRHTYATRMLQAGYPDQYVQQILGHCSILTTKDIYSHVLDEMNLSSLIDTNLNDQF